MSILDRYCKRRYEVYRRYYTGDKVKQIREEAQKKNNRGNVYAIFEYKDEIYIKRSDCYVFKDAHKVLKDFKKREPEGQFVIFTELAALNASLPLAGDL